MLLAIAAAVVLLPAIGTGWYGDDAMYSYLPAAIGTGRVTLAGAAYASYTAWLASDGRWHPGLVIDTYLTFALFHDRIAYKIFLIGISLLALAAGADFFRRIWGRTFAALAMLGTIACFQIRGYHDPFLAYNGLIQIFAILTFVSLSCFASFARTRKTREIAAAVVCYFLACSVYEIGYVCAPLYFVAALACGKSPKSSAISSLPFAAIGTALLCGAAVLRLGAHVDPSSLYAIHPDALAYVRALTDQITAALPLTYLLLNPSKIFTPFYNGFNIPYRPLVFVIAAACAYLAVPDSRPAPDERKRRCALAMGLLLIVLPALELPALLKYQHELEPGLGYLPVFLEYFGTGSLFATLVLSLRPARAVRFAVTAAFALAAMLNFGANAKLESVLRVPFLTSRESFERAAAGGLLDAVDRSHKLAIVPAYPWVCDDGTCIDDIRTSDMITRLAKRPIAVVPPSVADAVATYDETADRWSVTAKR